MTSTIIHNSNGYCFFISSVPISLCGDIYLSSLQLKLNDSFDMDFIRICLNDLMNVFSYNILCDLEIDTLKNNKINYFCTANNIYVGRQFFVVRC